MENLCSARSSILIADDNEDDALLTETALIQSQLNIATRIVCDGEAVLAYLRGGSPFSDRNEFPFPSLLLLDLHMPRLNGLEVLAAIRAASIYDSLPVVVVSASDLADNVANSYSAGANEFVFKSNDFVSHRNLICDAVRFWLTPRPCPWFRRPPRGIRFWNPDPLIVPRHRNHYSLPFPLPLSSIAETFPTKPTITT